MTDHASSILGVALRVCKLDASGAPLTGAKNGWLTNQFISMKYTPEYIDGDEVEQKAADGSVCVYYKADDVLKRVTFELLICNPEPDLTAILAGGTLLSTDAGTTTAGYAAPVQGVIAQPNGIGIELWSRAIVGGKPAATNPYWCTVFPYVKLRFSGDRVAENGLMANSYEGWGVGNDQFGDGPAGSWPFSTSAAFQYARAGSAPTATNDYVTVV